MERCTVLSGKALFIEADRAGGIFGGVVPPNLDRDRSDRSDLVRKSTTPLWPISP